MTDESSVLNSIRSAANNLSAGRITEAIYDLTRATERTKTAVSSKHHRLLLYLEECFNLLPSLKQQSPIDYTLICFSLAALLDALSTVKHLPSELLHSCPTDVKLQWLARRAASGSCDEFCTTTDILNDLLTAGSTLTPERRTSLMVTLNALLVVSHSSSPVCVWSMENIGTLKPFMDNDQSGLQKEEFVKLYSTLLRIFLNASNWKVDLLAPSVTSVAVDAVAFLSCISEGGQSSVRGKQRWFGGSLSETTSIPSRNLLLLVLESILIIHRSHPTSALNCFQLLDILMEGTTESTLTELLLEQDDFLFDFLLVVTTLHIDDVSKCGRLPAALSSFRLWALVMRSVHFDHQVIVDWLASEPSAVLFLLRFLKLCRSDFMVFKNEANDALTTVVPCTLQTSSRTPPCSRAESGGLQLTVVEHVGDTRRYLEIGLCGASDKANACTASHQAPSGSSDSATQEQPVQLVLDVMIRLRLLLEKLQTAGSFPFTLKPLIKQLNALEMDVESSVM